MNAGKQATAHEARINFHGWIGEGYVLVDLKTGAGAFMISGGGNGGETVAQVADVVGWISFAAGLKTSYVALLNFAPAAFLGVFLSGINLVATLVSLSYSCPEVFDTVALISVWIFVMAFVGLSLMLSLLGVGAIFILTLISVALQAATTYVGREHQRCLSSMS